MYKLVIVEDEQDIRRRIAGMIQKSGSSFELAAEYENGIDAYDGILSENPDVILTDIRIPYINGIELAKKVREVYPLVKIVVITGFSEFDYAKEAANLGVVGFINKPVTQADVSAVLEKVEAQLDSEFVTKENLSRLKDFYESSLPMLRENDLHRLAGMSAVSPVFEKRISHNEISLNYSYFAFGVFDFDETLDGYTEKHDIVFALVRRALAEGFRGVYDIEVFSRNDYLCLLLKSNEPPDMARAAHLLEGIIQQVGRYSDMPLSVGLSAVHKDTRNFAAILREARHALGYRGVMGGRKVFVFGSDAPAAAKQVPDDGAVKELGYLLRFKPVNACLAALDEIRQNMDSPGGRDSFLYMMTSILNALLRACDNLEGLYGLYAGQSEIYRRLFALKSDEEIFAFFVALIKDIRALNDDIIVDTVERNLQKVLSYMEAHFCDDDISFESMARAVNFSVSYISALLKKNRNTSFVKLLTGLRMEKAKELLADPALKIIDVAEQVGYSDSYYFSHCFKKYTGLSPKEFRSGNE